MLPGGLWRTCLATHLQPRPGRHRGVWYRCALAAWTHWHHRLVSSGYGRNGATCCSDHAARVTAFRNQLLIFPSLCTISQSWCRSCCFGKSIPPRVLLAQQSEMLRPQCLVASVLDIGFLLVTLPEKTPDVQRVKQDPRSFFEKPYAHSGHFTLDSRGRVAKMHCARAPFVVVALVAPQVLVNIDMHAFPVHQFLVPAQMNFMMLRG